MGMKNKGQVQATLETVFTQIQNLRRAIANNQPLTSNQVVDILGNVETQLEQVANLVSIEQDQYKF